MKKEEYNIPSWDEIHQFTHKIGAKMRKDMDRKIYESLFPETRSEKIPDFLFPYFGDIKWSEELPRMCSLCREIVSPATLIVDSWLYLFCPDCHYCFGSYKITGESVPVSSEF